MRYTQTHKKIILSQVILLITLAQFNSDIFLPSMPAMVFSLEAPIVAIQRVVLYAMVAFGVALLFWGPLSDHYGRRPVALAGMAIFGIGSLITALTPNLNGLIVGHILQGVGISVSGALSPVIPKDIFEGKALLKAFASISMAMAIIPMIAQIMGGSLQSIFSWRANFLVLLTYGLLVAGICWRYLPETNPAVKKGVPDFSAILRQYWQVGKDWHFLGYLGCLTFIFSGEMLYTIVSPFWLQLELGLSAAQNGLLAVVTGAGLFLGAWLSSRLADTRTITQLMTIGLFLAALSTLFMWCVTLLGIFSVWSLVLPYALYMVGAGFIYPNAIAGIIERFSAQAGIAGALMSALQMALAGIISSLLRYWVQSPEQLPLIYAVLVLCVFACYCLTRLSAPVLSARPFSCK